MSYRKSCFGGYRALISCPRGPPGCVPAENDRRKNDWFNGREKSKVDPRGETSHKDWVTCTVCVWALSFRLLQYFCTWLELYWVHLLLVFSTRLAVGIFLNINLINLHWYNGIISQKLLQNSAKPVRSLVWCGLTSYNIKNKCHMRITLIIINCRVALKFKRTNSVYRKTKGGVFGMKTSIFPENLLK